MAIKKSHDWPNGYTHNQPGLLNLTRYQVKIQLKLAILSQFFVINSGILDTEIIHLAWIFDLLRL